MAAGGDTVTCAELELRSNRLAHFLRASGLRRLDHYAIFIENNTPYVECCSAGECVGLYYTCISSYLTPAAGSWLAHPYTSRLHLTARGRATPHAERFADAELHYRRRAQRTRRNDTMEKERLLAFTDGVIAVIITIMVLEMKVPQDASRGSLRSVRPVFLSYAIAGERVRRF